MIPQVPRGSSLNYRLMLEKEWSQCTCPRKHQVYTLSHDSTGLFPELQAHMGYRWVPMVYTYLYAPGYPTTVRCSMLGPVRTAGTHAAAAQERYHWACPRTMESVTFGTFLPELTKGSKPLGEPKLGSQSDDSWIPRVPVHFWPRNLHSSPDPDVSCFLPGFLHSCQDFDQHHGANELKKECHIWPNWDKRHFALQG